MKKVLYLIWIVSFCMVVGCGSYSEEGESVEVPPAEEASGYSSAVSAEGFRPFAVYVNKGSIENHFIPSGWMGDAADVTFHDTFEENPHSSTTCIKVEYASGATGGNGWAGIFWQSSAHNWGNKKTGYDLSGAKRVTFWARGEKGEERIEEFKIGGITGEFPDSDLAGIGPVILTPEWKKYTIDLAGKDVSYING
ncbi:hypothetical protein ACFL38_05400, partial [Candidatus Omnitrophota bacterium]